MNELSTNFAFLQDYKGGLDGRVWLVCAISSGAIAVLKFPKVAKDLDAELSVWTELHASFEFTVRPRKVTVASTEALLMPFVFTAYHAADGVRFLKPDHVTPIQHSLSDIDQQELNDVLIKANPHTVALEAMGSLFDAGYQHDDITWRHVGFVISRTADGKLARKSVLIDLTHVSKPNEPKDNVVNSMCQRLTNVNKPTSRRTNN